MGEVKTGLLEKQMAYEYVSDNEPFTYFNNAYDKYANDKKGRFYNDWLNRLLDTYNNLRKYDMTEKEREAESLAMVVEEIQRWSEKNKKIRKDFLGE